MVSTHSHISPSHFYILCKMGRYLQNEYKLIGTHVRAVEDLHGFNFPNNGSWNSIFELFH